MSGNEAASHLSFLIDVFLPLVSFYSPSLSLFCICRLLASPLFLMRPTPSFSTFNSFPRPFLIRIFPFSLPTIPTYLTLIFVSIFIPPPPPPSVLRPHFPSEFLPSLILHRKWRRAFLPGILLVRNIVREISVQWASLACMKTFSVTANFR